MVLREFSAPGGEPQESSLTEGVGLTAREVDFGGRQEGRVAIAREGCGSSKRERERIRRW